MADFQKGDRVRVIIEGVVADAIGDFGAKVNNDDGHWLAEFYTDRPGVTVEKVKPSVEVFQPGDIVRDKNAPEYLFVIAEGGYIGLPEGKWWETSEGDAPWTSKHFEKVELPK